MARQTTLTTVNVTKKKRVIYISDSDEGKDAFTPNERDMSASPPPKATKRKRTATSPPISKRAKTVKYMPAMASDFPHPSSLHSIETIVPLREDLLSWYQGARSKRNMPWRKDFDAALLSSQVSKTQRAYEVLVSEIMLQQTQVTTVIPYYNKWMQQFPTIDALADASIEDVNQYWKGLGYYSRAARLLATAQKITKELGGKFPETPADMQKQLAGVGRYTAGAVSSIVFNVHAPAVDGNVLRLFSRLLALHAPIKSKAAQDIIWNAAEDLVKGTEHAGAFNQALIELGSTICKPKNPNCGDCPLKSGCGAYRLSNKIETTSFEADIEDLCTLCEPFPDSSLEVERYPMKTEKKKPREEDSAVNVIEWRSPSEEQWFLLIRRPETGLLAGLWEFPTTDLSSSSPTELRKASLALLEQFFPDPPPHESTSSPSTSDLHIVKTIQAGSLLHVFSHIRMTYHASHVLLLGGGDTVPEVLQPTALVEETDVEVKPRGKKKIKSKEGGGNKGTPLLRVKWVKEEDVEQENISTGALKIWNQVKTKR